VLRFVVLANAVVLNAYRADNFVRPWLGALLVAVMLAWTPLASWLFTSSRRRTLPLLLLDLLLAVGPILLTPAAKGAGFSATVPGFWVMGALLAWAVHYRWRGGLVVGAALAAADVAVRQELTQANAGNLFLLLIGGVIVGSLAESLALMAAERDAAQHAAAAAAERARLARAVHDGVLQVLALVQRRGGELGGAAADLGRLAGEQEAALRALIRDQDAATASSALSASSAPAAAAAPDRQDLARSLAALGRPGVEVVATGTVPVPAHVATEVTAAVAAALDNVARHAGPDARAWVLLEDWPDRVVVTVRDDGPGIAPGRLDDAEADGRLGVRHSIRGRVEELGGTATVHTGPDGTEWELTVPTTTSSH
jgi:signal transduction histidine kinase